MAKILINKPIYSFYAEEWINQIHAAEPGEDLEVLLNTPGGSVFQGWGIIEAMAAHEGKVIVKISGHAASMGIPFFAFADEVIALDVTNLMIHRAFMFTENDDEENLLKKINNDLYSKLKTRVNDDVLKEISGMTLKQVFESEEVKDIWLSAKDGKKIGLIDKVVKLQRKSDAAAFFDSESGPTAVIGDEIIFEAPKSHSDNNNKNQSHKMDLNKLKNEHPELYAQAVEIGVQSERDRVEAWAEFNDVDASAVKAGITSGNNISQKEIIALTRKSLANGFQSNLEDGAEEVQTPEAKTADEAKKEEVESFLNEVDSYTKTGKEVK